MTKDQAADILVETHKGTPGVMRARRSKARRAKLLAGDHQMIRAMLLTAVPKGEPTPPEVLKAVKVLMES